MAVVDFMTRLKQHNPAWMLRPGSWIWMTPSGVYQGPGMTWRHSVGLSNLLWLSLDMDTPPKDGTYDMRGNMLSQLLIFNGHAMYLDGLPLYDQAASLTLAQFRNALETKQFEAGPPAPHIGPLLLTLANGRLIYAKP